MVKMEKMVYSQIINRKAEVKFLSIVLVSMLFVACAGSKKARSGRTDSTTSTQTLDKQNSQLISYAKQFLGVPYKYGGNTPSEGFDCSGYVKFVYNHFNISVPRVTRDYANFGKKIALKDARVGDLILFSLYDDKNKIGHIGIVSEIQNGTISFLHAASGAKSHKVMESTLTGVHLQRMLFITRVN